MERKAYPTDVTDSQWSYIEDLIPPVHSMGRPLKYTRREIVNAIFYMTRSGCAWRNMPHDLPDWQVVFHYFNEWKKNGVIENLHDRLRELSRKKGGVKPGLRSLLLTVNQLKSAIKEENMDMIQSKKSMEGRGILLWIVEDIF